MRLGSCGVWSWWVFTKEDLAEKIWFKRNFFLCTNDLPPGGAVTRDELRLTPPMVLLLIFRSILWFLFCVFLRMKEMDWRSKISAQYLETFFGCKKRFSMKIVQIRNFRGIARFIARTRNIFGFTAASYHRLHQEHQADLRRDELYLEFPPGEVLTEMDS